MSLISEDSPVIAVPELDIFAKAPVQTSIEGIISEQIRPLAQLNTGGHIEFVIHNAHNEYVRLNETTLYLKFRVRLARTDSVPVSSSDWSKVSVVNNLLHSLWSQIDLCIGDSQTTSALQTYPYRAYFDTVLGSTEQSRKTHLQASLFVADDLSSTLKDFPQTNKQTYINHRTTDGDLTTGRLCELEGKLHLDLFMQHRTLIGGTKIKIKLVPNRPEFYFMSSERKLIPRIEFQDIHLNIIKSKVSEDVSLGQLHALNISPAKYILNRSEVRSFTIDRGATNRSIENVINGQLPRRVYLAFTSNEAYGGSFEKNPYFFHHYHINSLACFMNGEQYPRKAFTPDFDNDIYTREFIELYRVSGQLDNDSRMMIDKPGFKNGYSIFAFNLSQDSSQGYPQAGYVNVTRDGVLRFEIHFSQPLDTNINAIVYCEFDNQLNIGEDRNAYMDYR